MGAHNLSGKEDVALNVMGGLIAMSRPETVPKGGSPRTFDTDYALGLVQTRPGLASLFSFSGAVAERAPGQATGWINPGNLLSTGPYATTSIPSNALSLFEFAFSVPATNGIVSVAVGFAASATAPANLTVSLTYLGAPIGVPVTVALTTNEVPFNLTLPASLSPSQVNSTFFGVQFVATGSFTLATASLRNVALFVNQTASLANFSYVKTFETKAGVIKTLALDVEGNLWIEDVNNNPGTLSLLAEGITPGAYGQSVTLDDREYLCFSNLRTGVDVPKLYTPQWVDKITQVGPGAPPQVTVRAASSDLYPISTITQPTAQSRGYSYFLQSTGPGSNSPGNVVTIYYSDSTGAPADADLVAAFNSGNTVYLYTSFTGGPATQGPYVVQVTSVGEGQPPNQPRSFYYYTYVVPTVAYTLYSGSGHAGYTAKYQRTLATLQTSVPVPNLVVNSQVTITGNSVAQYNSTWTVAQDLDSGNMTISQSSLTAGTANFNYTISSGQPPKVGQLVTITNVLNANGALNGVDLTITSATGGASGSFMVGGYSAVTDFPALAEQGLGVTAGEVFAFDPGALLVGQTTDPIYGTGTGGNVVFSGPTVQLLGQGTRQLVEFYIDRNGTFTFPSPPVTFTTPANTTDIVIDNASIGPLNIAMRGYAITEPGQNGTPGANFFFIDEDIAYTVEGVSYTTSAFLIRDNVTTTASFNFTDSQLINATAIDIQGNNLFEQVEIGNPAWCVAYQSRMFYGLCQSIITNFVNMSFDGGQRSGSGIPLGWTSSDSYGSLIPSPVFGNAYYVYNSTGATTPIIGAVAQTAYQDVDQQPIIEPNTLYSVDVSVACPSGASSGNLVVDLYDMNAGIVYGSASFPLSAMMTTVQTFNATLLTNPNFNPPSGLQIRVYGQNIPAGGDFVLDRLRPFPTLEPINSTSLFASYVNRFSQVNAQTGDLDTQTENQQPLNGGVVMNDVLYLLKESSMGYTQNSAGDEPDQWGYHQTSNRAGAGGPLAYDFGEQFITMACRNGLYLFTGGEPGRMMIEIVDVWNAINWEAGRSIWVKHDIARQRVYVGIPLPTPNFWLPYASPNGATSPNVILVCNYEGISSGEELKASGAVRASGFTGNLEVPDLRRKWSLWQVPALNAAVLKRSDSLDTLFALCNGAGTGKVYYLNPDSLTDDGAVIHSLYTTYAVTDGPTTQLGNHRKTFRYFQANAEIEGTMTLNMYANQLTNLSETRLFPANDATEDIESDVNTSGQRVYMEFSTNDAESAFALASTSLTGGKASWNPVNGV